MDLDLFDYIFKGRKLAHKNQPIEILTDYTEIVKGRFQGFYEDPNNKKASIIEIQVGATNILIKHYEVVSIRLTYIDEYIQNTCAYSLGCAIDYFEVFQKAEISLSTGKKISGYLTGYPDSLGNFEAYIDLTTDKNESCTNSLSNISAITLIFEPHPYFELLRGK